MTDGRQSYLRSGVMAGYVRPARPSAPEVHDGVVLRSDAELPTLTRQLPLGEVACCLFDGEAVVVRPHRWTPVTDGVVIGYVAAGDVVVEQDGRSVEVATGRFALYDGRTPYRVSALGTHRYLVVHVPDRAVRLGSEDRAAVVAHDLSAFSSADALAGLLARVVGTRCELSGAAAQHLGEAVVSLLRAVVADVRGARSGSRSGAWFEELATWIDQHLADPDLSAERLATEHFLSERYVRKVFADHGSTVSSYVKGRRLERIRDELLDPRSATLPVSAIATRWGFPHPSVFTRAFTQRFGQGPSSFRRSTAHEATKDRPE